MSLILSEFNMYQEQDLINPPQTIKSSIPLIFQQTEEDGIIHFRNEEFGIYAYGRDLNEAYFQLHKKIFFIWEEIINEHDFNLSKEGLIKKYKLKKILSKIR